jgi:cold shock CspA family protein
MQAQRHEPEKAVNPPREKARTEMAHGHICEIHPQKGFGRIETQDGRIIYFYKDSVTDRPFAELTTGTEVRFTEKPGSHASAVQIID